MESSAFPVAMHLTSNNVTNWEHYMNDKLTADKDVVQAIRNKMPFVLLKPTIDDLIEETNVRATGRRPDRPCDTTTMMECTEN